jgi:hypothetical protein
MHRLVDPGGHTSCTDGGVSSKGFSLALAPRLYADKARMQSAMIFRSMFLSVEQAN